MSSPELSADQRPAAAPARETLADAARIEARAAAHARADQGRRTVAGIGYMILAVGLFSVMDAIVKWLSSTFSTIEIIFFRSVFAFLPLLWVMARSDGIAALRITRPGLHVLRCAIGMVSMYLYFVAYKVLPFADAIALGFAAPLFMTALSVPLLGEKVGIRRWSAVAVGFSGVLLMLRPGGELFQLAALVPIVAAFTYALAMVIIRQLSRQDGTVAIVFYFTAFTLVVSAAALPWTWVTPRGMDWVWLAAVGLIGGVAQIAMTRAFTMAPIAVVAPFEYTAMLWAVGLGWFVWGTLPDAWTWAGSLVLIGSGLYILHREAAVSRAATREARALN
jgi:drug/metabolite transporter (DMT)-like permease